MRKDVEKALAQVERVIVGKREVIETVFAALLADGHILLDDVPGVGKTTLAVALSRAAGLDYRRVQCTPDVLPSDIVGFTMYDRESGAFVYRPGVVNGANLLLVDEINRAPSKTQSALLEAMEERQVTVDGATYQLKTPFVVIATQNSVGSAGTQQLPFAQLDRFLVRLSLGYPNEAAQLDMMRARQTADPLDGVEEALTCAELLDMRESVAQVNVADAILLYITRLSAASRAHALLDLGISPRGALFVNRMAKARAWLDGRDYVTGADVQRVFCDVCAHRVALSRSARAQGIGPRDVLEELLKSVPVPDSGVVA